jgi:hypothetical protein
MSSDFRIEFVTPLSDTEDPCNANIDAEIFIGDDRYLATFFTLDNIRGLSERDARSGECAGGIYFWAVDMVIVERLTEDVIRHSVEDLLREGNLARAFTGPLPVT